jgi:hypothetical protein
MSFTQISDMVVERRQHTATLISCSGCGADGKVLIVGGWTVGRGRRRTVRLGRRRFRATASGTVDGWVRRTRRRHRERQRGDRRRICSGRTSPTDRDLRPHDRQPAAGTIAVRRTTAAVALDGGRVLLAGGADGGGSTSRLRPLRSTPGRPRCRRRAEPHPGAPERYFVARLPDADVHENDVFLVGGYAPAR